MNAPLLLRIALGCGLAACTSAPVTRIVDWNTYHLFDHRQHCRAAAAWLAERQPTIVALQEVLHVDAAGLRALAGTWGHDHAVMHKQTGYPVALTSSAPIEVVERRVAGWHHGYLHARTHGFDVFVVHFWPGKVHEAEHVAALARELVERGRAVLVVGDFNGEIRHDEAYLQAHGHLGEVVDGVRRFDYRLTDALLDAAFVDLTHQRAAGATHTFGSPALIPAWRRDMQDVARVRRRIDFVFADVGTARRTRSAQVVTDDRSVGRWSDHYPIVVEIDREPAR